MWTLFPNCCCLTLDALDVCLRVQHGAKLIFSYQTVHDSACWSYTPTTHILKARMILLMNDLSAERGKTAEEIWYTYNSSVIPGSHVLLFRGTRGIRPKCKTPQNVKAMDSSCMCHTLKVDR